MNTLVPLALGVFGLVVGLATVWARLGRTGRAQSWATLGPRVTFTERFVLAVAPLAADTMLLAVFADLARPVPVLRPLLLGCAAAAYVAALAFAFGAPIPRRVMPTWFRVLKRMPVAVPPDSATAQEKIAA